jgi:hypothetical protein
VSSSSEVPNICGRSGTFIGLVEEGAKVYTRDIGDSWMIDRVGCGRGGGSRGSGRADTKNCWRVDVRIMIQSPASIRLRIGGGTGSALSLP